MENRDEIKQLLNNSEVFPKYIHEMLIRNLDSMTSDQLDLLLKILREEKEKLSII